MTEETDNNIPSDDPESRGVANKTALRLAGKIAIGITIVVASIFGYNKFNQEYHNKGLYDNHVADFLLTEAGQLKNVKWVQGKGINEYACYGIGQYMKSSPSLVAGYLLKLRRAGVKDIYFIYSQSSEVTQTLDFYQSLQTNDSCKFSGVLSEIEQYNTGLRKEFYATIKTVSDYCLKHNLLRACYQGWFNGADIVEILKNTDRLFNHSYMQYDKSKDLGQDLFLNQVKRLQMIVIAMDIMYPKDSLKKYNTEMILSCENPDKKKTQFGYKYFSDKYNSFEEPYSLFIGYWNGHATKDMKRRIALGGSQLFVGDQAKTNKTIIACMQDIVEFIIKYWQIIVAIAAAIWFIIKMHFRMNALKAWTVAHDKADKEMKDEIISLIDRNKEATDNAANSIEIKLDKVHDSVIELSLMNKLLLENKLKQT